MESHATMGAMERANLTLREMLRTLKHATETRVGGRLETDHPIICWMVRHCCWILCRYHVRADGRTPIEVLRNNSYRGGVACFGEVVWVRVPGTRLLRGKYEVNWLEKSTCAAMNTVCANFERSDDNPSQPDGGESFWTGSRVILSTPSQRARLLQTVANCQWTCNGASESARMSTSMRRQRTRCQNRRPLRNAGM